jgi:tetratricopeptide (TPR) repeat protein
MKIKQGKLVRGALIILGVAGLAWASGPNLDRARKLYNLTEFQQSLEVLQAVPNKDAAVYELMGRNYYGQGEFKKATEVLEKAAALEPGDSNLYLWLGRVYGRRAETSSMITAPGFANKARQYFERAAQLSPSNLDAQSDLFSITLRLLDSSGAAWIKRPQRPNRLHISIRLKGIGRRPNWTKSARNSHGPKRT